MKTKLLSVAQVSELLGVTTRTVWRMRDYGAIPAPVRMGGSVRWRSDEIEAWIKANCPHCRKTGWRAEQ